MERVTEQHPPRLPPGVQAGDWRVVAWHGQGAYGAIYRAVRMGQEQAGPSALKFALYPWDARVIREAELLSRFEHPSIPRLLGRGVLCHASGVEHPWFVMEWVEGTPLYDWAQQHAPSHRQVCQVLAQLARALEAIHAAGAVHRDVKGDNVLVRHSDGRAVLIDFGSGHFQGAERLTWQSLAPFTSAYLSAQASLFHIRLARERDSYYPPSASDDLFALGVMAYHLVMGEYPPPLDVREDEQGNWQVSSPDPRLLLERNSQVKPPLRELILRLLSDSPEARGTAAQVAEVLEAEVLKPEPVAQPTPGTAQPLTVDAEDKSEVAQGIRLRRRMRSWKPWLAVTAAAGVCAVLLWGSQPAPVWRGEMRASTREASDAQVPDADPSAVGDTAPSELVASVNPSAGKKPPAQDSVPEPRPGQTRPDGKGRCPGRKQVRINGGCWVEQVPMTAEECMENGFVRFKGKCYTPALEPPQKTLPTSSPAKAR